MMKHPRETRSHPAIQEMLALLTGDLSSSERTWLTAHADQCEPCREQLRGAGRLDRALSWLADEPLADGSARVATVASPIGPLRVFASQAGIRGINFVPPREDASRASNEGRSAVLERAVHQIQEYFAGTRRAFDVPLDMRAVAPFHEAVLREAMAIPFGSVSTYGSLAQRLGRPRAARAVGGALNRNPLPILIPCHRVLGGTGSLVGYAGGLDAKRYLLRLEGALAA